jgi:hypothetical protein
MNALGLSPIKPQSWEALLIFCRTKDVELGETTDFMYGVRKSTQVLTIWTQQGWREGWYVARICPVTKGKKIALHMENGSAPTGRTWSVEKIEQHLRDILSRIVPEERP